MDLLIILSVTLLAAGMLLGLLVRGRLLLSNRRAVDLLAAQLAAEQHIQAHTHATLRAMHEAARRSAATGGDRP